MLLSETHLGNFTTSFHCGSVGGAKLYCCCHKSTLGTEISLKLPILKKGVCVCICVSGSV